jgi:hypothetical protein
MAPRLVSIIAIAPVRGRRLQRKLRKRVLRDRPFWRNIRKVSLKEFIPLTRMKIMEDTSMPLITVPFRLKLTKVNTSAVRKDANSRKMTME